MSNLPEYRPYQATVVFSRTGEPEIIAQETFKCDQEFRAEVWAAHVARVCIGYDWLKDAIRIINITYWYTEREAPMYEEKEDRRYGDRP